MQGEAQFTMCERLHALVDRMDRKFYEYAVTIVLIWPLFSVLTAILLRSFALPESYTTEGSGLQESLASSGSVFTFFFTIILVIPTTLEYFTILNVVWERRSFLFNGVGERACQTLLALLLSVAVTILLNIASSVNALKCTNFSTWESSVTRYAVSFYRHLIVISLWTSFIIFRVIANITHPSIYNGTFTGAVCIIGPFTVLLNAGSDVGSFGDGFNVFLIVIRMSLASAVLYKDVMCVYTVLIKKANLSITATGNQARSSPQSGDSEETGGILDNVQGRPAVDTRRDLSLAGMHPADAEVEASPSPPSLGGFNNINLSSLEAPFSADLIGFTPGHMASNRGLSTAESDGYDNASDRSDDNGVSSHIASISDNDSNNEELAKLIALDKGRGAGGDDNLDVSSDDSDDDARHSSKQSTQSTEMRASGSRGNDNSAEMVGLIFAFVSSALIIFLASKYYEGMPGDDANVDHVVGMTVIHAFLMLLAIRCTSFLLLDESFQFLVGNEGEQSNLLRKRELLRRFLPDDVIRRVQKRSSATVSRASVSSGSGSGSGSNTSGSNTVAAAAAGGGGKENDTDAATHAAHPEDLVVSFLDISVIDAVTDSVIGRCMADCVPHVTAHRVTFRFNLSEILKQMDSDEGRYSFM